jgi:hypothetical protein
MFIFFFFPNLKYSVYLNLSGLGRVYWIGSPFSYAGESSMFHIIPVYLTKDNSIRISLSSLASQIQNIGHSLLRLQGFIFNFTPRASGWIVGFCFLLDTA